MRLLLIALSVALLTGCATEFKQYEGHDAVRMGQGGTRENINGMDVWSNGDPPRKYKILGVIEDERGSGGFSKPMRNSAVVSKAKEIGGDALIEGSVSTEVTGMVSNGFATANTFGRTTNAFGSGFAVPVGRMQSKYTVIKYVD